MAKFTKDELDEAIRSIDSTRNKCVKALEKLREGTPQHTLTVRRIKAFDVALALINKELEGQSDAEETT